MDSDQYSTDDAKIKGGNGEDEVSDGSDKMSLKARKRSEEELDMILRTMQERIHNEYRTSNGYIVRKSKSQEGSPGN